MGKFFDVDSPFMSGLTKMADLMILNLLMLIFTAPALIFAWVVGTNYSELATKIATDLVAGGMSEVEAGIQASAQASGNLTLLVFCVPLTILCGAAFTALHYVCLKMVRNEECYIVKSFFRSFKQNFKQATLIWLIYSVILALIGYDYLIIITNPEMDFPDWLRTGLIGVVIIMFALVLHTFPLQARFENKISKTIKNSALVGFATWPKTVIQVVIWFVPIAILIWIPEISPILLLFGISLPAWGRAKLYSSTFKKFEPKEEDTDPDAWSLEVEETRDESAEEIEDNLIEEKDDSSQAEESDEK